MTRVFGSIRFCLEWWSEYWLRFQMVATPIGSLLVTLWLSQAKGVGWWWNSLEELEVAAAFASIGILSYTASFAALETGLWTIMVLALQALKKYEEDRAKRERLLIALGAEAERRSRASGRPFEEALKELKAENWQPPES